MFSVLRSHALIAASLLLVGCINEAGSVALNNRDLELMAEGRIHYASISRAGGSESLTITHDASETARRIVSSLAPIIRSGRREEGTTEAPEYIFRYQSGRNPVEFKIRICGDKLCYSAGAFDYEGGDAGKFKDVIDGIAW